MALFVFLACLAVTSFCSKSTDEFNGELASFSIGSVESDKGTLCTYHGVDVSSPEALDVVTGPGTIDAMIDMSTTCGYRHSPPPVETTKPEVDKRSAWADQLARSSSHFGFPHYVADVFDLITLDWNLNGAPLPITLFQYFSSRSLRRIKLNNVGTPESSSLPHGAFTGHYFPVDLDEMYACLYPSFSNPCP